MLDLSLKCLCAKFSQTSQMGSSSSDTNSFKVTYANAAALDLFCRPTSYGCGDSETACSTSKSVSAEGGARSSSTVEGSSIVGRELGGMLQTSNSGDLLQVWCACCARR